MRPGRSQITPEPALPREPRTSTTLRATSRLSSATASETSAARARQQAGPIGGRVWLEAGQHQATLLRQAEPLAQRLLQLDGLGAHAQVRTFERTAAEDALDETVQRLDGDGHRVATGEM